MIRTFHIRLVAAVILGQAAYGWAADKPSDLPPPRQPPVKSLLQLRTQVDKLLANGDPVTIRRSIGDVLELVNRLIRAGRQDEAFVYLSAALKYHPWALEYQLLFAEMLVPRGMTDLARERAELVLRYAEQDGQVNRARKLLQQGPLPPIPRAEAVQGDSTTLVLVPVGTVDTCVLDELRGILQVRLNIPVLVQDARVHVPKYKKDPLKDYLASARKSFRKRMEEDERLAVFLQSKGIRPDELERDSVFVQACRELAFSAGNTEVLARFDAGMEALRKADKQWYMSDLLRSLRTAVYPFRNSRVYFLGVANLDAFEGQSNFIFGTAETGGHHAMLAYRRFTAAFNGDTPNRKRLVDRMLKQSLSSVGFMLGIGRCSNPACARVYPHSLQEHDAKSTELCHACELAFERVLGVELQKNAKGPQGDRTGPR